MTDHSDQRPHDDAPATEPTEPISAEPTPAAAPVAEPKPSRWARVRPRGRLGQVAAILVATAAAIVIVGSIFMAGFAVGSEGGGEHHGHGGGYGHSEGEGDHHGDGDGSNREDSGRDGSGEQGSGPDGSGRGDSGQGGSNDGGESGQG